jgi:hypothetical protein
LAHLKSTKWRRIATEHLADLAELVKQVAVDHRDWQWAEPAVFNQGCRPGLHNGDVPSSMMSAFVRVHRCSACWFLRILWTL